VPYAVANSVRKGKDSRAMANKEQRKSKKDAKKPKPAKKGAAKGKK
jgi:hypothetical protein